MYKKIFSVVASLWVFLSLVSIANANSLPSNVWRLDGIPNPLPRNFRLMIDDWKVDAVQAPSRKHLDDFHISASGQPTFAQLKNLFDELKKHAPNDKKIFMVDLRQESHGFADEYPVSWYVKSNRANVGKTFLEIEIDEWRRVKNLRGQFTKFLPLGNYDTAHFRSVSFAPAVTLTERQAAKLVGFQYARFYALDMTFPTPDVVDEFLKFVAQLDSDSWLHFHCQAGHGRTTTFMVMLDILQHPDVEFEDILRRQFMLGGSNLLDGGESEKTLRLFYDYAHQLQDKKISATWSEWLAQFGN